MTNSNLDNVLVQSLIDYIEESVEKGFSFPEIKSHLITHGHNQGIVDVAIRNIIQKKKTPSAENGTSTPVLKLEHDVKEFIKSEKSNGKSTESIRKELLRHGHSEELISKALELIRRGDPKYYNKVKLDVEKYSLPGSILFLLVIAFNIVVFTQSKLLLVIASLLPSFIVLVVNHYIIISNKKINLIWVVPLIISFLYYVLAQNSGSVMFLSMENLNIMILNIIISYIFTGIYFKLHTDR